MTKNQYKKLLNKYADFLNDRNTKVTVIKKDSSVKPKPNSKIQYRKLLYRYAEYLNQSHR